MPAKSIRISFLPPPLEGTISLGIYNGKNELVRVLHREADFEDFAAGEDSLRTAWDGKNDRGEDLPPGRYTARGFVVGDVKVEGVAFFFNDWVTDDTSPHIQRIENFARNSEESLLLLVTLAGGKSATLGCDLNGQLAKDWKEPAPVGFDFYDLVSPERRNLRVEAGKLSLNVLTDEKPVSWAELVAPEDASYGKGETVWVIDKSGAGDSHMEVKQFSGSGEFLRRLSFGADEPSPKIIRASARDDKLFLLEENQAIQRMRALRLLETKSENGQLVSDWKIDFEKKIIEHKNFTVVDGKPIPTNPDGKTLPETITLQLQANPLEGDRAGKIEVLADRDGEGSYLKTRDGLPLRTISETPCLTRVLALRSDRGIDVFEDDGAVVQHFQISGAEQMMAFDGGDFELK